MKRLIEFPLEDGTSKFLEVNEPDKGGIAKASYGNVIEKAQQTLEWNM